MLLDIIEAIENKRRITFSYHEKDRVVEIYLCGLNSKGQVLARGFEISPANSGLKLWRLEEMSNIKITETSFLFAHPQFKAKDGQIIKTIAVITQ
jgi:hypothetical protein